MSLSRFIRGCSPTLYRILALLWTIALFYFSSRPSFPIKEVNSLLGSYLSVRNVAHFLFFAILSILLYKAFSPSNKEGNSFERVLAIKAVLIAIVISLASEIYQYLIPSRHLELIDIVMNSLGSLGGIGAIWVLTIFATNHSSPLG